MGYFSQNRHKFYLKCHTIFVCKYRKQLINENVRVFILSTFKQIEEKSDFEIEIMETDKDHIHYMIETRPNINLSNFVRAMKGYITYHIWEKYSAYLCKCFWKEKTFFTDGYFICSVGNVSEKTLKEYIENQG